MRGILWGRIPRSQRTGLGSVDWWCAWISEKQRISRVFLNTLVRWALGKSVCVFSPNSLLLGFYLRKKELATLTGRAPELCGWALCPGLVLLLSSLPGLCSVSSVAGLCVQGLVLLCPLWLGCVAGLCVQALSSSCPPPLWLASVSGSCPPLVLVLAAPLNSVARLCGPVYWRGVWPNK